MLVGKPLSGTSHAALDFVGDQQRIVLACQFVCCLGKFTAYRPYAAFALDKLKADGADRGVEFAYKIGNVIEFHELHAWNDGSKGRAIFFLEIGGQRAKSAPVEGMFQRQNAPLRFRALRAAGPRISTGQLERSFPGFSAAVGEKSAVHTGNPR